MISFWRWGASVNALFVDREWSVTFTNFPQPPTSHGIPITQTARFSLARVLLEAGSLLTPAVSPLPMPPLFAIFRYAHIFTDTQPDLALPTGSDDLDPRLLGLLAEDVGVGVTGILARHLWGVRHLADVEPLISKGQVTRITPPPDLDYANSRPDYLGVNKANEAIFFESKGAVGAPHKLKGAREKGKKQVGNVATHMFPMRTNANRIVIATNLPIKGQNKSPRATTFLDDPVVPERRPSNEQPPDDLLVRHAYAKILSLAGLADVAALLILRLPLPEWLRDFETVPVRGRPFVPVGPFPVGGTLCFELHLWKVLITIDGGNLLSAINGVLANVLHDDTEPLLTLGVDAPQEAGPPAVVLNNGAALVGDDTSDFRAILRRRREAAEW